MKDAINENKLLVLLIGVLALAFLGGLYYYLLLPKVETKTSVTQEIEALTVETRQLQQEIGVLSAVEEETVNELELRTKLPKKRALNTLLLSLQEAELMSEAKIISVSFNDYDALVSESTIMTETEDEENQEENTQADNSESVEGEKEEVNELEKPQTRIDIAALPDALKLLSLGMDVEVQDYEHLLSFLKEIESIERVIRVDQVEFSQIGEEGFAEKDMDESIIVTIQLTTFYSEEAD